MSYDLSFDETATTLGQAGLAMGPSEAHGILTGLVCAGHLDDETALSALGDPGDFPELLDYVTASRAQIAQQLYDADLAFAPLLPSEDLPEVLRSRALTQWCGGFITGFYFRGPAEDEEHGDTLREALQDIGAIAEASGTVDESDLTELIEYIRVAVQLVYEETQT